MNTTRMMQPAPHVTMWLQKIESHFGKTYSDLESELLDRRMRTLANYRIGEAAMHIIETCTDTYNLPNYVIWQQAINATIKSHADEICSVCGRTAQHWYDDRFGRHKHICLGCRDGLRDGWAIEDLLPAPPDVVQRELKKIMSMLENKRALRTIGPLTAEERAEGEAHYGMRQSRDVPTHTAVLNRYRAEIDNGRVLTAERGYIPANTAKAHGFYTIPLTYDGDPRDITSAGIDTTHAAYYRARGEID